jgi:hypothetical protein
MPPREMKGRYIMREYWQDGDFMTQLDACGRELYIGLAMLADDTGWIEWHIRDIAAALYRYEPVAEREAKVKAQAKRLRATGRLIGGRCGHAFLPKVAKRPRKGVPDRSILTAHKDCPGSIPINSEQSDPISLTLPDPTLPDPSPTPTRTTVSSNSPTRARSRGGTIKKILEEAEGPFFEAHRRRTAER